MNLYNRIQGRSLERLAALSDGIFAVAMTLLVLDLHIPTAGHVHGARELLRALGALGPQWVADGMSFLTLGNFWAGQQTQLNHIREGSRDLTWIHLGFLFTITLLPLSTRLLAEFITYRSALLLYWLNILAPRSDALLELKVCHSRRLAQRRHAERGEPEHLQTRRGRSKPLLCRRGSLLPYQNVGKHRRHCAGAVELCPGTRPRARQQIGGNLL